MRALKMDRLFESHSDYKVFLFLVVKELNSDSFFYMKEKFLLSSDDITNNNIFSKEFNTLEEASIALYHFKNSIDPSLFEVSLWAYGECHYKNY